LKPEKSKKPNEIPLVSKKFLKDNQVFSQTILKSQKKKGGPYNKADRLARRNEVYRLHFEYGYSAMKISELMKIHRNTISGDIQYWYGKILKNTHIFDPEHAVILNIERLEIQRSRLRERLDKADSFQEKNILERLSFDIDCKILNTYHRLAESKIRMNEYSTNRMNRWLKENNKDERYLTVFDKITVSRKAYEKIKKIINEDDLKILNS